MSKSDLASDSGDEAVSLALHSNRVAIRDVHVAQRDRLDLTGFEGVGWTRGGEQAGYGRCELHDFRGRLVAREPIGQAPIKIGSSNNVQECQMEADITWGMAFRVWWLFFWRSSTGAMLGGAVIGFVIGGLNRLLGFEQSVARLVIIVLSPTWAVFWSVLVVKMMLRKHYRGFDLVPVQNAIP